MSVQAVIPLIATVAYIPLFIVLLINRPWQRKQKLFLGFLIPATLWSLTIVVFRSDPFAYDREALIILSRTGICLAIATLVGFHYFASSFYRSEPIRVPYAYLFVVAVAVLAAMGVIPRDVTVGTVVVNYGLPLVVVFLLFLPAVGIRDIRSLVQRRSLSTDPVERNQIVYLLVAIGILTASLVSSVTPRGGEYPVSHIGNTIVAAAFTYAIVAHRLLDLRVVFRRAVINMVLYGGGLGVVLLGSWVFHRSGRIEPSYASLTAAIAIGIPVILVIVHKLGAPWRTRMERAFIGERYAYRRQLSQFLTKIQHVRDMQELGEEFISLLARSVDCRRACLLLPETPDGTFASRFRHPPSESNPMSEFRLAADSPVIEWLRQNNTTLLARELSIFPEFQGMWSEEKESVKSMEVEMFLGLISRGDLAGILAIGERRDGRIYSVEDIDLLESIANQMAVSLEKEYYHEQIEEHRKEIDLLNRLAKIVTSSMSIDAVFEGFVGELKHMVDFDWATISLVDGDELHILALASNTDSPWRSDGRLPLAGTATDYVCRERRKVYEPDLAAHQRFVTGKHHLEQGVRSILYLPLQIKEKCIGAFILASRERDAFGAKQIRLLEQVAMQIATPVENSQLYAAAEQRSRIDEMTGLFNRRHFEERIKEEISRHGRDGEDFSILYLDLDNFKTYNDIYGHPTGDTLLNQIGRIIKGSIRGADQAFRYGGDEFVVILPRTGMGEAHVVAERVRGEIAGRMEEMDVAVTCSIGVSTYPSDGVIPGELVTVADTAQYFAKRTGGNRVYLSSRVLSEPLDDVGVSSRHNGLSTIYALASIVEARDPYTYGHSKRVNSYAVALAEKVGLSPDEVSRVSTAAMLHDIGKIGIPDRVLNKKSKVTGDDWDVIKAHSRLGATIVGRIPNLVPCVSIILHHHERWDGGGYPEGLKGEEISIEARILAIADSFEAMTSARPYREALSGGKAIEELRRCAGSQFDPELVQVFIGVIEAGLPGKADDTEQVTVEKTGS